jgi:hypothetical protein
MVAQARLYFLGNMASRAMVAVPTCLVARSVHEDAPFSAGALNARNLLQKGPFLYAIRSANKIAPMASFRKPRRSLGSPSCN